MVGGQPGAGKSTLIDRLLAELGPDSTQLVSSDSLTDLVTVPVGASVPQGLAEALSTKVAAGWTNALVERAATLRAHIVWERAMPGDWGGLAHVARLMGYQVELHVIAAPLLESWLGTLLRDSAATADPPGEVPLLPRRIALHRMTVHYHRWPGFLAEVEDSRAVDALQVVNRKGDVLFHNRLGPDRRWQDQPFAAESLLVERHAPRSPSDIDRLLADWSRLRARPDIAFANHDAWPHADIANLGPALQALRNDPSLAFDLNNPPDPPDPRTSRAWLARLKADSDAACAAPEAPETLAPRADRLLSLVSGLIL